MNDICREKTLLEKINELEIDKDKKKSIIDTLEYWNQRYISSETAVNNLKVENRNLKETIVDLSIRLYFEKEKYKALKFMSDKDITEGFIDE